jgi:alkaline phosphatase D
MLLTTRRSLIAGAAVASAAPRAAWARDLARGAFTHGVASGDPLAEGVVLWTRFVSPGGGRIAWEISEEESFTRIERRGEAHARGSNDFCTKVDVRGLRPGRRYFFRFLSASGPSPTGQTRTAPIGAAENLSAALFSCANFAFGYFHAYGHAARREDIDLVLHVGDYIYEYERGVYPAADEALPERVLAPAGEIIHLTDYYQRYATYHTDPDLLELRRLKPMSAVWDDHEIANDAASGGAQNHQSTEGSYADRVAAASKAYFDWMPIRRPTRRGAQLYRLLDWGDLARIVLLDTRYIGRERQLDYRTALAGQLAQGGAEAAAAARAFHETVLNDPHRTLLGAEQEIWFQRALADSKRRGQTWQIIAQQVVMAEQRFPAGLSRLLPADVHANTRRWIAGGEEMGALGLPWNLDSWGGYPAARARFLQACASNANNAVVLGGDSHNCWLNNLTAPEGARLAAIEFAGGSVTSPGFERALSNAAPGEREAMMRSANPDLAWSDTTHRGYGVLRFTRGACEAEWVAFSDVRVAQAGAPTISRMNAESGARSGPSAWSVQNT